jgi:hypothetical protein
MTVRKAISHIDLLIQDKQDLKMKMIGLVLPLPIPGDIVNRFDRAMGNMLEKDMEWLQSIKRQLLPEQHRTKTVCRQLY